MNATRASSTEIVLHYDGKEPFLSDMRFGRFFFFSYVSISVGGRSKAHKTRRAQARADLNTNIESVGERDASSFN